MEMERISETQIKFILSQEDLDERGITTADLVRGSQKTQALFRDMMEKAYVQFDFYTENNTPLMVEAIPMGMDSMTVIVTKVTDYDEDNKQRQLLPRAMTDRKFRKSEIERNFGEEIMGPSKDKSLIKWDDKLFYSFEDLDTVMEAVSFLKETNIPSALYKHKLVYILVVYRTDLTAEIVDEMENTIHEFADPLKLPDDHELFLQEHGEIIIKEEAISILANL